MKLALLVLAVLGLASAMRSPHSQRDLQSDFEDIFGLIPFDEIRAIARKYAENDEEFREVVRYLQGPEWAGLVQTVRDDPTWQEFKVFMKEAGVDIDGVIKFIHDLITGMDVDGLNGTQQRGVREFVDEVLALVDTGAFLEALNNKLNTSPNFQVFFDKISSPKAYEMVEEIRAIEEVQRIVQRLREMGIDVDMVIDLIYGLLGWEKKMATRDLYDDFIDFLLLFPSREISAIARKYAENDEEFRGVLRYLQGPKWAALVETARNHLTWQEFKVFMDEFGVNIEGYIQFIFDIITGVYSSGLNGKQQRGLRQFVDEVLAVVDTEAFLELFTYKLNNNAEFIEFFDKISSQEAYEMVEEIRAIEEVQRISQRLRDMGIDVDMAIDLIYDFLEWQ